MRRNRYSSTGSANFSPRFISSSISNTVKSESDRPSSSASSRWPIEPSTVYCLMASRIASSWIVTENSESVRAPLACMLMIAWPISLRCPGVVSTPLSARIVSIHSIAQARSAFVSRNWSGQKARRSSSAATVKCRPVLPFEPALIAAASGYIDMPLSKA